MKYATQIAKLENDIEKIINPMPFGIRNLIYNFKIECIRNDNIDESDCKMLMADIDGQTIGAMNSIQAHMIRSATADFMLSVMM